MQSLNFNRYLKNNHITISCLLLILALLLPVSVNAQDGGNAFITTPAMVNFPYFETYLTVYDSQGKFIQNLKTTDIHLLEDGHSVPVTGIKEFRPGVQAVIAINPGPPFAIQNSQAVSRYDFVIESLGKWGGSRIGTTIDDLSLLTTGGPSTSHVSDPAEWLSTLTSSQVDAKIATPSLDTLSRAVDVAADPTPRPGMGSAVLFITPPFEGTLDGSLDNIASQAEQNGVKIFVWMVASPGVFSSAEADRLAELAEGTGGAFFAYSGEEELPDPETYFAPLRSIYQLTYESKIKNNGTHQIKVQVKTESGQITTPGKNFEFDIQPPQPAVISPPIQIIRKPPSEDIGQRKADIETTNFIPGEQELNIIFDFPDGRVRPILRSVLYVDGDLVAENIEPPFDQFIWNIEDYKTNGSHTLQVEVEDSLGLTGRSAEIPVEISFELPEPNPWAAVYNNIPVLSGLAILLAGSVLVLVLVMGGRLRPHLPGKKSKRRRKSDPVTQPVTDDSRSSSQRLSKLASRLKGSKGPISPQAYALLTVLSDSDDTAASAPIPITSDDLPIGSDPNQAILVLDDPSIDELHAHLRRSEDGTFRLSDEDTIAGTWINYTPVSKEGTKLEHGDLIHIGRVGFRFSMRDTSRIRKPIVTPENQTGEPIEGV
jgi:hypothetical protein